MDENGTHGHVTETTPRLSGTEDSRFPIRWPSVRVLSEPGWTGLPKRPRTTLGCDLMTLKPTNVLNSYDSFLLVVVQVSVLQDLSLQPDCERGAGQLVLQDLALAKEEGKLGFRHDEPRLPGIIHQVPERVGKTAVTLLVSI